MPEPRSATISLARLRVPLGFVVGALALWWAKPTGVSLAWGGGVAMAGEMLRIWAAGHLNKSREVTASGPYRLVAHPLYIGSSIMGIGLAVAANSVVVAAIVVAYLSVTLAAAIRSEEAFLRRRFGDEYDRYRGGADADAKSGRAFSLAQARANREQRAVFGLLGAALLLVLKATYNGSF